MRVAPDAGPERWFLLHEEECCLPAIALGELAFGIAKLEFGARNSKLQNQLGEWL
jgi:toxin FitB